jgi:photosystem II stability/assembly factor-like uncharacterized protein
VAWASGTGGTVLKTTDGGRHWQPCAIPDADKDGATLDFRGVQAWDASTAIVMASGPGDKSRLYKTTDGCLHWALLYTNPDKNGFWDAIEFWDRQNGKMLGDPVDGQFQVLTTFDGGAHWHAEENSRGLRVNPHTQGAFAASNSSLRLRGPEFPLFGSGGTAGAYVYALASMEQDVLKGCGDPTFRLENCVREGGPEMDVWKRYRTPIAGQSESAGIFSIAIRHPSERTIVAVAVGGDYKKPDVRTGTAARSLDGGKTWFAASIPPHGYRSTVQWGESIKAWITAGTNGSDLGRDDGKTWQPLDNGNWNALSLPFIVGPKGRIARLNPAALPKP